MRYFLGFIVVVALIVVVFILVLHGFSGGSSQPKNAINLSDYATSQTVVKLTVDGPINADPNHQAYRITIGRDANTIEVIKGYQNQVVNAQTYANNSEAYASFLRALQLLNFTKGNPDPKKTDPRGYCPTGDRYIFQIESGRDTVQSYWSTSCGGGTFRGNVAGVRSLFIKQIPDFNKITAGLHL